MRLLADRTPPGAAVTREAGLHVLMESVGDGRVSSPLQRSPNGEADWRTCRGREFSLNELCRPAPGDSRITNAWHHNQVRVQRLCGCPALAELVRVGD